jgi:hypothetical protein
VREAVKEHDGLAALAALAALTALAIIGCYFSPGYLSLMCCVDTLVV